MPAIKTRNIMGLKMLEETAKRIVTLQVKHPKIVLLIILFITLLLLPGILKVNIEPIL